MRRDVLQALKMNQAGAQFTIMNGLAQAKQKVAQAAESVKQLADNTKGRGSFLRALEELKADIVKLDITVSAATDFSDPVYENLVMRSQGLEEKIHTLYQLVQQSNCHVNDVDLMLRWVREFERILVDTTTPEYTSFSFIPTPKQIKGLGEAKERQFLTTLDEFKEAFSDHRTACFISYDWGSSSEFAQMMVNHLKLAGIEVTYDREYGPSIGRPIAEMMGKIPETDYVIVIGTHAYGKKGRAPVGSGVKSEAPLVQHKFSREPDSVLLILLEGRFETSFPDLLNTGQFGYGDFRKHTSYYYEMICVLERLRVRYTERRQDLQTFINKKKMLFSKEAKEEAPVASTRSYLPVSSSPIRPQVALSSIQQTEPPPSPISSARQSSKLRSVFLDNDVSSQLASKRKSVASNGRAPMLEQRSDHYEESPLDNFEFITPYFPPKSTPLPAAHQSAPPPPPISYLAYPQPPSAPPVASSPTQSWQKMPSPPSLSSSTQLHKPAPPPPASFAAASSMPPPPPSFSSTELPKMTPPSTKANISSIAKQTPRAPTTPKRSSVVVRSSPAASAPPPQRKLEVPITNIPKMAFGRVKWAEYLGVDVGKEPALPSNIVSILNGPCPIWSSKIPFATKKNSVRNTRPDPYTSYNRQRKVDLRKT